MEHRQAYALLQDMVGMSTPTENLNGVTIIFNRTATSDDSAAILFALNRVLKDKPREPGTLSCGCNVGDCICDETN